VGLALDDRQRAARDAYTALIGRVSVLVLAGGARPLAELEPSSGVLLATPGGIPYLLTAAHVVQSDRSKIELKTEKPTVTVSHPTIYSVLHALTGMIPSTRRKMSRW
jgi:hypothetical protein